MPKLVIVCPSYLTKIYWELTLFFIYSERSWGKLNNLIAEIWKFCHFCVQNEWKVVRWWHHQLTHLLTQKCFLKICETSKCHNFIIFQLIFIKFSLFCLNFFTLSDEIKSNLFPVFRISPLITVLHYWWSCVQTVLPREFTYPPKLLTGTRQWD